MPVGPMRLLDPIIPSTICPTPVPNWGVMGIWLPKPLPKFGMVGMVGMGGPPMEGIWGMLTVGMGGMLT